MFKFLGRCLAFVIGLALIADIALPIRVEPLAVDRHTSTTGRMADTDYTLRFIGGVVSSCSVGHAAYNQLKDGDRVEVRSTQLFRKCVHIARGDDVIEHDGHWKIFVLVSGLLLIAVAMGWLRSDDDDGAGFSVRLR